ncbi:MAG: hypothetical protein KJ070_24720, partial [Verrucomicrobia bacterium]|nr:hypothetical protein [Verrucomicrobiota bacterium]
MNGQNIEPGLVGFFVRDLTISGRMEATSDRRFDANLGTQLLLELAQEKSLEPLLKKLVAYAVERT